MSYNNSVVSGGVTSSLQKPVDICHRILTWNLCADQIPFQRWSKRRPHVARLLKHVQADVLGLQEMNKGRLLDLEQALPEYRWIGLARGQGAGAEYNPILYRASRFDLVWHETLWLSPTPSIPSRGWDAAHPRIVTIAHLRPTSGDNRDFLTMNCHLDHLGRLSRKRSIELLGKLLGRLDPRMPVVLMGDFNFSPRSPSYRELMQSNELQDSALNGQIGRKTADKTWRGFIGSGLGQARLDYLFSRNMVGRNYRVVRDKLGAKFLSDHFPVVTDFSFHPDL